MLTNFNKTLLNKILRVLTKKGLKPYMNLQNKETQKNLNSNVLLTNSLNWKIIIKLYLNVFPK